MSVDTVLIVFGAAILGLGLLSTVIKRVWLSVPLLAMVTGVVLGPEVLAVLRPGELPHERKVLEELARIALAVSLVATALQITRADLRAVWRRAVSLLTIAMIGMWLATSLGAWLLLDLPGWVALLLGAILTPTDPVVASSLVTGRLAEANLPRWLRRSLQVEAGANDGLALVFVLVPALVLAEDAGAGSIAGEAAREVGLALVVGAALGLLAAKVVDVAEHHQAMATGFFSVSALALAILTLGAAHAVGGSGILAAFVAGLTFSAVLEERYAEELERVQDALAQLVVVPVFVLFGALVPWDGWSALGWSGVAFAVWALVVRRPAAAVLALKAAPVETPRRGIAFLAWYGPLGVAAMYYTVFAERYRVEDFERLYAASTLAIGVSVVVFSVTATPGVRAYAGRSPFTTVRHPLVRDVDEAP